MAVRINGQSPLGNVDRANRRSASKKAEDKGETSATSDGATVSLSDQSGAARDVRRLANAAPDINEAKVARIRGAIARGEYTADLRIVAERIITEALLFGSEG